MIHLDLKFQTSWAKQDKEGAKEGGARERLSDDLSSEPSDTDMYPPLDTNTKISIPRPVLLTERLVLWKITLMINGRKATLLPFTFIVCFRLSCFSFLFKICFFIFVYCNDGVNRFTKWSELPYKEKCHKWMDTRTEITIWNQFPLHSRVRLGVSEFKVRCQFSYS